MTKIVFIDRDGVINRDPDELTDKGYVTCWQEFQFLPGALAALWGLTKKGYKIAIISNQAGVGRGIYTKEGLDEITQKMIKEIEAKGAKIYSTQYCIHKKEDNCRCRKPEVGLFKKAVKGLKVDFEKAYFIGDNKTDVAAGKKIGCKTILVLSGKTKAAEKTGEWEVKPDFIKRDLREAVEGIIRIDKDKEGKRREDKEKKGR